MEQIILLLAEIIRITELLDFVLSILTLLGITF